MGESESPQVEQVMKEVELVVIITVGLVNVLKRIGALGQYI
jgi:hypothetical protein